MSYGTQTSFVPRTTWVPAAPRPRAPATSRDKRANDVTAGRVLQVVRTHAKPVSCRELCVELDSHRRYVERRLRELTEAGSLICTRGQSPVRNQIVNLYKAVLKNEHH